MSYDENREWVNRQLIFYEDKIYNTGSSLSIDIATSTSDGKSFSPPKLYLRLRSLDGRNRTFSLDYISSMDLIMSLVKANFKNPDLVCQQGENSAVTKRGYNIQLHIVAGIAPDQSQIVSISLIINESDQGKIALPYTIFMGIFNLFILFKEKQWEIFSDLQNEYNIKIQSNTIKEIRGFLKTLPGYLGNTTVNNQTVESPEEPAQETPTESNELLADFEKFAKETDPRIPEVEHMEMELATGEMDKPVVQEVKSKLFEEVFQNSVKNFIGLVETIYHDPKWPTEAFISNVQQRLGIESFMPGISADEHKSLVYMSKVNFWTALRGYLQHQIVIPSSVGILRYSPSQAPGVENIELAYDILTLFAYIHRIRERRESRDADANNNLAITYTAARCFLDPLVFSFLVNSKPDVVKNCVSTRYKYYKEKGFFDLEEDVQLNEVEGFMDKLGPILSKVTDVKTGHEFGYEKGILLFPFENKHTLEQITNELVDKTVKIRLGESKDEKPKKVDHKKKTVKYNSNIHRVLSEVDFLEQIPKSIKEAFMKYIMELEENYDYAAFPLEELGDDVVKALYVWNESDNKKESYTSFRTNLEQCIMKKNDIIAKVKGSKGVEDTVGGNDEEFDFSNLVL